MSEPLFVKKWRKHLDIAKRNGFLNGHEHEEIEWLKVHDVQADQISRLERLRDLLLNTIGIMKPAIELVLSTSRSHNTGKLADKAKHEVGRAMCDCHICRCADTLTDKGASDDR